MFDKASEQNPVNVVQHDDAFRDLRMPTRNDMDNARVADSERLQPFKIAANPPGKMSLEELLKELDQIGDKQQKAKDVEKIEGRFETNNIEQAVASSKEKNLPLVVQIGASWCPHCQNMDNKIVPQLEGKNGLPEKAVILHLDYEKADELSGKSADFAASMKEGVTGFPTFKIFKPGMEGQPIAVKAGELSLPVLKRLLKSANIETD